jgi:hypothetical protein
LRAESAASRLIAESAMKLSDPTASALSLSVKASLFDVRAIALTLEGDHLIVFSIV